MPDSASSSSGSCGPRPRARVRFWGTRGTCASPGPRTVRYGGNTPCVEVRGSGGPILVLDAGTGIRALGQYLQTQSAHASALALPAVQPVSLSAASSVAALSSIEPSVSTAPSITAPSIPESSSPQTPPTDPAVHLFLTHRHADHVMGLPHFAPLHARSRAVHVRCGDGDGQSLTTFVSSLVSPPLFPYVDGLVGQLLAHEWPAAGTVNVGDFTVHRFGANHPGEAAIIRIDDASGPLLAYAPDNELAFDDTRESHLEWLAALRSFLAGVPLLIHDAMYTQDELPRHIGWGHSSDLEAARLALQCGVSTLALFHHHPDRDDDAVERMVDTVRHLVLEEKSGLRVLAAWEGLTLSV